MSSSSGSRMSQYTTYLANAYCGGSSRKLIASWWYAILAVSGILMLMSLVVTSTRIMSEGFASVWSAIMLIILSIGGTMIMRKFHNSFAVGFFMGSVVCMSQLFFLLFLVYVGYAKDRNFGEERMEIELIMAFLSLLQCTLLGSFAIILGAHRSEILDKTASPSYLESTESDEATEDVTADYEPPRVSLA